MVCGESGPAFAVIKPASTTFAHCLVWCKFCSPVQVNLTVFSEVYISQSIPSFLWKLLLSVAYGQRERKKNALSDKLSAAQDAFPLCQFSLGFGIDFVTQRIYKGIKSGFLSLIAGFQDPEAFCYSNPKAKSIHTIAATTANICRRWMKRNCFLDLQTDQSFLTILDWAVKSYCHYRNCMDVVFSSELGSVFFISYVV